MDLVPDSMPLATSKYKNDSNKSKVVFRVMLSVFGGGSGEFDRSGIDVT